MFHVKHLCSPCEEGICPLVRAGRSRAAPAASRRRTRLPARKRRPRQGEHPGCHPERAKRVEGSRAATTGASRLAPREAFILVDSSARNPLASERKTLRERPRQQKLPNIGNSLAREPKPNGFPNHRCSRSTPQPLPQDSRGASDRSPRILAARNPARRPHRR